MDPVIRRQIEVRKNAITRTKRVLIDVLQVDLAEDEIAEDAPLFGFGLGLDSIDALTLLVAVEDQFGIQVSDEDALDFRSVNSIADFVIARSGGNAAGDRL
jgi:acyl carrier protein